MGDFLREEWSVTGWRRSLAMVGSVTFSPSAPNWTLVPKRFQLAFGDMLPWSNGPTHGGPIGLPFKGWKSLSRGEA
jgi:hypothetical protein